VATDNSGIIGSVKVTLWDEKTVLPIEKLFGIQVNKISREHHNIWHVGRFAISKSNGLLLLKQLLVKAISTICSDTNSLMVAECDKKFVKGLSLMGLKTEALAPSIFYLGSETIPVFSTYEWLNNFLIQAEPALLSDASIHPLQKAV